MYGTVLIADFDVLPWQSTTSPAYWTLAVVGILLLVILIGFLFATLWRVPRGRHHHSGRRHRNSKHAPVTPLPARRKRGLSLMHLLPFTRRHRRHRLRNPTLAEVGGSPPQHKEHPPAA